MRIMSAIYQIGVKWKSWFTRLVDELQDYKLTLCKLSGYTVYVMQIQTVYHFDIDWNIIIGK